MDVCPRPEQKSSPEIFIAVTAQLNVRCYSSRFWTAASPLSYSSHAPVALFVTGAFRSFQIDGNDGSDHGNAVFPGALYLRVCDDKLSNKNRKV